VGILTQTTLIARRPARKIDGVGLCSERGDSTRCAINLLAVISKTGTIDIKPCQDLRNRFIEPQDYLDVSDWILGGYCDCIFGPNGLSSS